MRLSSARGVLETWKSWEREAHQYGKFCEHAGQSGRKRHRATERQSAKWTETRPGRPSDRPSDRQEQNKQQGPDLPLAVFGCLLGLRPRKPGRRRSHNRSPESMRRPTVTRTTRETPQDTPRDTKELPKQLLATVTVPFWGAPCGPQRSPKEPPGPPLGGPPGGPGGPPGPQPSTTRPARHTRTPPKTS